MRYLPGRTEVGSTAASWVGMIWFLRGVILAGQFFAEICCGRSPKDKCTIIRAAGNGRLGLWQGLGAIMPAVPQSAAEAVRSSPVRRI